MECPRCKLVNPPTAKRCDCGYDFNTETMELRRARRAFVEEIIAPEGPLDRYLRGWGADSSTAKVYLIGSSATGRSHTGELLAPHSDIDLLVYAKKPDGSAWRLGPSPNEAFRHSGIRVEVQSGYVGGDVGDVGYYEWTIDVPEGGVLVRRGRLRSLFPKRRQVESGTSTGPTPECGEPRDISDEEATAIRKKLDEGWRGPMLVTWLYRLLDDRDERRKREAESH